jgi:hypothetical protein
MLRTADRAPSLRFAFDANRGRALARLAVAEA